MNRAGSLKNNGGGRGGGDIGVPPDVGVHPNIGVDPDIAVYPDIGEDPDIGVHPDVGVQLDIWVHPDVGVHHNIGVDPDIGVFPIKNRSRLASVTASCGFLCDPQKKTQPQCNSRGRAKMSCPAIVFPQPCNVEMHH